MAGLTSGDLAADAGKETLPLSTARARLPPVCPRAPSKGEVPYSRKYSRQPAHAAGLLLSVLRWEPPLSLFAVQVWTRG